MNKRGIAIVGSIIADIGYTVDIYPKKGNLTWMYDPIPHTGGANNLLVDLARLDADLPLKYSGQLGDDEDGRFVLETLAAYPNIDVQNVTIRGRTAKSLAMTERESKERTFFYDPGSSLDFCIDDIDFEHLEADFFLLEYLLLFGKLDEAHPEYGTYGAEVLRAAQKRGMKTFVDMVSEETTRYESVVRPALKYVDYYISNEVEASGVLGYKIYDDQGIIEDMLPDALDKIKEYGVQEWVIIHSPKAGYGLNCRTGEKVKVPSMDLPKGYIKGTTGAGDAFCAGVIYSAYKELDLTQALRNGARCAALSLSKEDSNSGVISYEEMQNTRF
ncbi:sugar/nucleoside kinase (ribokinase family) [Lachnospiraceae bacterium PM6-15]|uniref:carbohydrate kinase family protein n=1 Tax=Ohessyouella blattaphilus TaxID=2949333 RepID=UPI003E32E0B8